MLGGFHTACTFIACIGKLWGDAGLRDMLVDSTVYAGNTADHMLKGKQFHRAVRGLTICFEALFSLLLENFQAWLFLNNSHHIDTLLSKVMGAYGDYESEKYHGEDMKGLEAFLTEVFTPLLDEFIAYGRNQMHTFSFWADCVYALHILLSHIRAEREGDWDAHLASSSAMLPFFRLR